MFRETPSALMGKAIHWSKIVSTLGLSPQAFLPYVTYHVNTMAHLPKIELFHTKNYQGIHVNAGSA